MRSLHFALRLIEDIFHQNPGLGTFSNKTTTRQQPHIIIHHKQRERYYFTTNIKRITSSFIKQQQK
jgi:hypothetical protein